MKEPMLSLRVAGLEDAMEVRPAVTARIVAALVKHLEIPPSDVGGLILWVHAALDADLWSPPLVEKPSPEQIRASITPEFLVSFENGLGYKMLVKHLAMRGITPAEYRAKWGLPNDYPMVSANHRAEMSETATRIARREYGKLKELDAPRRG